MPDTPHPAVERDLHAARLARAAAFATQGLILLSLTTRLPEFQDRWHLSDVDLSLCC